MKVVTNTINSSQNTTSNEDIKLSDFPNEILIGIFQNLGKDFRDLHRLSRTCKRFNNIIFKGDDNDQLWFLFAKSIGLKKVESTYLKSYKEMIKAIKQVSNFIDQTEKTDKCSAQVEFVKLYLNMDEIEKAILLIDQIPYNSSTQKELVYAYLKMGEIEKAILIIDQIEDAYQKALAQGKLFETYLKMGEIEKAISIIEKTEDIYYKNFVQIKLVKAYLQMREKEKAILITNQITYSYQKALAQIMLVKAYPEDAIVNEKANLFIDQIPRQFSSNRDEAQVELVKAYLHIRDVGEAILLIDQIGDSFYKGRAQKELVKAYLQMGEIEKAISLIAKITDPENKALAQLELVKAYPEDPYEKEEARELISKMKHCVFQSEAQRELVKVYLQIKNKENAISFIDEITDPYQKALAQIKLVKAYPEDAREKEKIISFIGKIKGPYFKAIVQMKLVKAYFKKELF